MRGFIRVRKRRLTEHSTNFTYFFERRRRKCPRCVSETFASICWPWFFHPWLSSVSRDVPAIFSSTFCWQSHSGSRACVMHATWFPRQRRSGFVDVVQLLPPSLSPKSSFSLTFESGSWFLLFSSFNSSSNSSLALPQFSRKNEPIVSYSFIDLLLFLLHFAMWTVILAITILKLYKNFCFLNLNLCFLEYSYNPSL